MCGVKRKVAVAERPAVLPALRGKDLTENQSSVSRNFHSYTGLSLICIAYPFIKGLVSTAINDLYVCCYI